jgi:hypothetical protein
VSLGIAASVAGCAGEERPESATTRTTTHQTTRTTDETTADSTTDPTDETTTDEATTPTDHGRAIEFVHRNPVLASGVGDAETWYYARVFSNEREASELDLSSIGGVAEQDPTALRRFVAETDFEEAALFAVQAEVESVAYGLEFDFVDEEASPPQVVGHLDSSDREDGDPATSTLLVRVPVRHASKLLVTLVDRTDACTESICVTETFDLPNQQVYETATIADLTSPPNENLGVPGGALVTTPDAAERFTRTDAPFADFVRATDLDESYLLAVQLRLGANGYHLWPTDVRTDGSKVAVQLRRGFGGGLNAEFTNLTLARISSDAPESGTATVRKYDGRNEFGGTQAVSLSTDPADWSDS